MNETDLLRAFRENRSEEAFSRLVNRYAGLVYSVAKRRVTNAALAEDITQIVFIRFARTPPRVQRAAELAAWLHRTAVNVSIDLWRSEGRRRAREQKAAAMESTISETTVWDAISPGLDEALNQLSEADRRTILLRFFSRKSMRDVGEALGIGEDAAKMRVSRAVDRLRTKLGVGGAVVTPAILAGLLLDRSVEAAPGQLVARLSSMKLPAIAGATGLAGVMSWLLKFTKFEMAAGVVGLAVVVIAGIHAFRPPNPQATSATVAGPQATAAFNPATRAAVRLYNPSVDAAISGSTPAANKVMMLFHVLDSKTGGALEGAKVQVVFFGAGGQGEGHDYMTDDGGTATILEPGPGMKPTQNVFVVAEEHVPMAVSFRTDPMPAEYTIKLDPAMTVGGLVVDDQGQPVSGVKILVQTPGNRPGQAENVDFQTCPVTNRDDGSWTCSYIPLDYTDGARYYGFRFILQKPGFAATLPALPMTGASLTNLVLVIDRGFTVNGRVVDEQGQPITNAGVTILTSTPEKRQSTRVNESGFFTFAGAAGDAPSSQDPPPETNTSGAVFIHGLAAQGPEHVILVVQADGYSPQTKTVELSGETNTAEFTLAPGNIFRGQVSDEAGNPISNAVVQTDWNDQGMRTFPWTTRTDANGRFEWDSAPAGPTLFWFEASGYAWQRDVALVADGTDHDIRLSRSSAR